VERDGAVDADGLGEQGVAAEEAVALAPGGLLGDHDRSGAAGGDARGLDEEFRGGIDGRGAR
jgi:hypothetical protein